jgi:hypothetical protein
MSLGEFMKTHTSEDNRSFEEIQAQEETKRKQKFAWLYQQVEFNQKLLELKGSDPNRTGVIEMWPSKAQNLLMHTGPGISEGKCFPPWLIILS